VPVGAVLVCGPMGPRASYVGCGRLCGGGRILGVLVTLAPGADPRTVLDLLFQRKTLIANYYANLSGYLDWAVDTARVLRNQIRPSDIDRLVFTPRLWRLEEMSDRGDRFANALLTSELTERAEVFDQAHTSLQAEINRWNPAGAVLTVVDTSVFIHHACKIREIDYAAAVGAGFDPVRLVLPRVVVDELDRLKESGNQAVRWRAGHTLGVLDELLRYPRSRATIRECDNFIAVSEAGGMPREKVTIEVFFDDPQHLRMDDPDDEIIDRALALQAFAGQLVRLLTMDTSMALRARMLELDVRKETRDICEEPAKPEAKRARGNGREPAQPAGRGSAAPGGVG